MKTATQSCVDARSATRSADTRLVLQAMTGNSERPLIVHMIYRLSAGGLENGLVNLINHLPQDRFRHAIICLKDFDDFRDRIEDDETVVFSLNKPDGKHVWIYLKLWNLLRRLKPAIVHTRNLGTLDCVVPAALAGVPFRIHGEHGWDMFDLHGTRRKYRLLRRTISPLVDRYVTVSKHLAGWLIDGVGIPGQKIEHICNGVDTEKFSPGSRTILPGLPNNFITPDCVVLGTVGRMQSVKGSLTLVRAFLQLLEQTRLTRSKLRLVMVGGGPLRDEARSLIDRWGATDLAWLPGERSDIPNVLRLLDVFVLPSLNEGISNTILEAMATALPVVATRTGGNPELVDNGLTGYLVPVEDPSAMAAMIETYLLDADIRRLHGENGRQRVEREFSIDVMVRRYDTLYESLLTKSHETAEEN